jgi:tRNA (guanine37-N1)-methyltransferase
VRDSSIWARAINADRIVINTINIRDYATDKHRRADDYPFGGGSGMVLMPGPVDACFKDVTARCPSPYLNVYMSPCGKQLTHRSAVELSQYACINILCGHYEGVDERVLMRHIDCEISIGDYVLTGGELPAMVLIDACMRHLEGVLGNDASAQAESFADSLLEHPQYTRPAEYDGMRVPEVLLSGHHENVAAYHRRMSLRKTAEKRPDLLSKARLKRTDMDFITKE